MLCSDNEFPTSSRQKKEERIDSLSRIFQMIIPDLWTFITGKCCQRLRKASRTFHLLKKDLEFQKQGRLLKGSSPGPEVKFGPKLSLLKRAGVDRENGPVPFGAGLECQPEEREALTGYGVEVSKAGGCLAPQVFP